MASQRKVDRFDTVGSGDLKHIDIERQIESPPNRNRTATANFVPTLFYYGCVISTVSSVIFSVSVAEKSSKDGNDCFSSIGFFIPSRRHVLLIPIFLFLYSLALRNIPIKHDHYYFSVIGFLCSIFYFATAIYLTVKSWKCSNVLEKVDILIWIFLSFLWLMTWLYFTLTCFYLKYLKQNPLKLLLFVRCVCIPPEVKKVMLVLPYVLTAGSILINADRLSDEECTLPLNAYSVVTALIILMMGLSVASILFFGREHPILEADLEENENNEGLDNTNDSSSASAEMTLMAKKKPIKSMWCSQVNLRLVFQIAGFIHVVALIWACVGVFWYYAFSSVIRCDEEINHAAIASESSLFFFFFADVAIFYLFKIESCFPSILDSKLFHSPFVEQGLKICKIKIEKARGVISPSKVNLNLAAGRNEKKKYSRVVDLES